jgi:hypothetical protein
MAKSKSKRKDVAATAPTLASSVPDYVTDALQPSTASHSGTLEQRVAALRAAMTTSTGAPITATTCARCEAKKEELSLCARCGVARYCSRACQVAHWSSHKDMCKAYCGALRIVKEAAAQAAWLKEMQETPYVWPAYAPVQLLTAASQTLRQLLVRSPDFPKGRRTIAAHEPQEDCVAAYALTIRLAKALFTSRLPEVPNRTEGAAALGRMITPLALGLGALHDGGLPSRRGVVVVEVNTAPIERLMSSNGGGEAAHICVFHLSVHALRWYYVERALERRVARASGAHELEPSRREQLDASMERTLAPLLQAQGGVQPVLIFYRHSEDPFGYAFSAQCLPVPSDEKVIEEGKSALQEACPLGVDLVVLTMPTLDLTLFHCGVDDGEGDSMPWLRLEEKYAARVRVRLQVKEHPLEHIWKRYAHRRSTPLPPQARAGLDVYTYSVGIGFSVT